MSKKLLNKEQVYETFNPVLDGSSTGSLQGMINTDQFDAFCDRPTGLVTSDDCCDSNFTGDGEAYNFTGARLSLSATFINGKPLTDWSARFMNQPGSLSHVNRDMTAHLSNMYHLYDLVKDRVSIFVRDANNHEFEEHLNVTNINILKITKPDGINIDFTLTFDLNDYKNIFCKFSKFNTIDVKFSCDEISKLSKENQLRVKGKILNTLLEYLKPETGYYTLLAKEFYIFTYLGEIDKIYKDTVIEVLKSTDQYINIRIGDKLYIIKKPDYYYFNWYFSKK